MTTYIVTFEINDKDRRLKVKEYLKSYSYYCPIHQNAWAVMTDKKAVDIRNALNNVTESVDRVFVIRTGTEAAWRNSYGEKNNEWLKKNL